MEKIIEYTAESEIFWDWTEEKIKHDLGSAKGPNYFNEGEIWWAALGKNVGSEIDGKSERFSRPVFILKRYSPDTCLILPSTTQIEVGKYYHYSIQIGSVPSVLVLTQVRTVSTKRLLKKIQKVDQKTLESIKAKFSKYCI